MDILVALDAGTSSVRAIAFTTTGDVLAQASRELALDFVGPRMVEQNPTTIAGLCLQVLGELERELGNQARDVAAIGITNQRETVVAWDRKNGDILYPAISWQDSRGDVFCNSLLDSPTADMITMRTGLIVNPYFSASKIAWLYDNSAFAQASFGAVGTLDSYLIWVLTGSSLNSAFVSDISNACRTMLVDLDSLDFDQELLSIFGVNRDHLPQIISCAKIDYRVAPGLPFAQTMIGAAIGDQQASLFGQRCFSPLEVKTTYGSGNFILANSGTTRHRPNGKVIESVAWKIGDQSPTYCLEGSVFSSGTIFRWLKDNMGILLDFLSIDEMAQSVRSSEGVVLIPSLQGLGAPYWSSQTPGAIFGISGSTLPAHIVRAAVEAVVLRTEEVVVAIQDALDAKFTHMAVDGGLSKSDFVCQLQADQLQIPLIRSRNHESTALGAALLAGISADVFATTGDIPHPGTETTTFVNKASTYGAKARRELWMRYMPRMFEVSTNDRSKRAVEMKA